MRPMWGRVKLWAFRGVARVFIVLLPPAYFIDAFLVNTYERFVGDPLQLRGFDLVRQVRTLLGLAGIGALFAQPYSWLNLFPAIIWMARSFFESHSYLEPGPSDSPTRNWRRVSCWMVMARWGIYFMGASVAALGGWYWIFIVLAELAAACDPKPPRPRRVRVLVAQTEGT